MNAPKEMRRWTCIPWPLLPTPDMQSTQQQQGMPQGLGELRPVGVQAACFLGEVVTMILLHALRLTRSLPPPQFIHSTGQSIMRHGTLSSVATAALLLAVATPSVQASLLQQQDPQEWKGNAHVRALLR